MTSQTCTTCGIGCCPGKRTASPGWHPNWRSQAEAQRDLERQEADRWKRHEAKDTGQGPVP